MINNTAKLILLLFLSGNLLPVKVCSQVFSLEEAVKTGMQNNPGLKAAELNIEKQEALKLKSINIPGPQFFIEYEGIKGSINNFETRKIGILQEMEFPALYFFRAGIQSYEILVARAEKDLAVNELKHDIKKNYYGLLLQTALLNEARANLQVYEDFLNAAERKYDAGATSNLEVLSAKVNRVKFENEIRNIRSQANIYKTELKRLLNTESDIIPSEEMKISAVQSSLEELLNAAIKYNPQLIAARYRREKSFERISLSRSELLPNLSLKYYRQKTGAEGNFWGFELGIGIPLWFWWQPTGNIKEAELEYSISQTEEVNIKRKIESELNRSFEEYLGSARQLEFLNGDAMSESNEILRQARTSYTEGSIDYVELLQALSVSYELKVQYFNILFAINSSINDLERLTSGSIKLN